MQADQRHILQRPAEPRGGQAEGGGLRQAERLRRRNRAQQHVADAIVERIAARQHHDRPAAMLLDFRHRLADRAGPGEPAAADQPVGQAEMALAAHHQLGRGDQPLRHRREAVDAVLADADDGQPTRGRAGCPPVRHRPILQCVFSSSAAPRKPLNWPSFSPAMRASRRPCRWPGAPRRPSRNRSPRVSAASAAPTGSPTSCARRRSTR